MTRAKEWGISVIRTAIVPPIAAIIIAWLVKLGIKIDSVWVFTIITFVFNGIWYSSLRLVEILAKNPKVQYWAGIFLGHPAKPVYVQETKPQKEEK